MGLMDFLAQAGQGRRAGSFAQAFGGQTDAQKNLANFTDNELPKYYEAISKATTRKEIEDVGRQLSMSWLKAGLQPNEAFEKFSERLIGPALQGMRDEELSSIQRDYGPQTKPITPMAAPQGQGQPLVPGTTFEPQTTPGKPFDVEGAFRLGRTLGTNAPGYHQLLQTPAEIAQKEASRAHTEKQTQALEEKSRAVNALPDTAPEGQVSQRTMGLVNPGGLSQFVPQRELSGGAMDLKKQGLEIQQQRLAALADRVC